jgi:molybdopterin converting factor small subunit
MDKLKILVFGQLTDITGTSEMEWDHCADTERLRVKLLETYPGLSSKTFRIAVDNQIVEGSLLLKPGAVIALLPPFSGG